MKFVSSANPVELVMMVQLVRPQKLCSFSGHHNILGDAALMKGGSIGDNYQRILSQIKFSVICNARIDILLLTSE